MSDRRDLTPMMAQFRRIKDQHPQAILLFRMGDFYETFFDDAALVARELEITLTSREAGKGRRVPMAGVPHHAVDGYVAKLLDRGYRVAICDQVEDPAKAKGLVRREVTRVITPATTVDSRALEAQAPNYLAVAVASQAGDAVGLAVCDFSTGEFRATQIGGQRWQSELAEELNRIGPRELLLDEQLLQDAGLGRLIRAYRLAEARALEELEPDADRAARLLAAHLGTVSLAAFGLADQPAATVAAYATIGYLRANQAETSHLTSVSYYDRAATMRLDPATGRHLEIVANARDGKRTGSLWWALDMTRTALGSRLLRSWLLAPLTALPELVERQAAVAELVDGAFCRAEVRQALKEVQDLERLAGRAGAGQATARDLLAIRLTLQLVPKLREALAGRSSDLLGDVARRLDPVPETQDLVGRALADSPPLALTEGGLIRDGFDAEVDRLRELRRGGRGWLASFEARERERTGIKTLKIGYNRVFGYYIEVTRSNLAGVPDDYTRRQTLAGAERYVTPELKEREAEILGAEEKLFALEYELFGRLRSEVAGASGRLRATAGALAELDCLAGLAELAAARGYVRPELADDDRLEIGGGRHPVLELTLETGFVPNDVAVGGDGPRVLVITGPNMAGKSTYLRQVALLVLMAQVGSFVPAAAARIGLVDRVFTRIGAHDDLAAGQSTFMVEMQEVAHILRHATARSLVILDEVGRGTSTFDGISLARAVVEHLSRLGAATLFATHYHELIALAALHDNVANYSTAVLDRGGEIVFPHKVRPGGADRSYGIEVARLAGLPASVLSRAGLLLRAIEAGRGAGGASELWLGLPAEAAGASADATAGPGGEGRGRPRRGRGVAQRQVSFLEPAPSPVLEELKSLDVYGLTPLEALNLLARWQQDLRRGGGERT